MIRCTHQHSSPFTSAWGCSVSKISPAGDFSFKARVRDNPLWMELGLTDNCPDLDASVYCFQVVPPPGTVTSSHVRSLSTRRRTLECTSAPGLTVHPAAGATSGSTSPRRVGSFRRNTGSSDRPPLMFCRRRPSWPEVDIQATSG